MAAAGNAPFSGLGLVFGGLITLAPWTEARFGIPAHPLLALAAVVFSIRMLLERAPDKRVEALSSTLFGLVYVALLLQYLVRIVTPVAGRRDPRRRAARPLPLGRRRREVLRRRRAPDGPGDRAPPHGAADQPEEDLGGRRGRRRSSPWGSARWWRGSGAASCPPP